MSDDDIGNTDEGDEGNNYNPNQMQYVYKHTNKA